jgi:hypothetical protein
MNSLHGASFENGQFQTFNSFMYEIRINASVIARIASSIIASCVIESIAIVLN